MFWPTHDFGEKNSFLLHDCDISAQCSDILLRYPVLNLKEKRCDGITAVYFFINSYAGASWFTYELMGLEKHGSKSGGGYVGSFFQLFEWNGKSRRKLFANKSDLPGGLKQGKKHDHKFPMTRFPLVEDVGNAEMGFKGSSDHSCASSATDDEGHGIRAPGVVARLMGLDSLPASTGTEPYLSPPYEPPPFQGSHCQRKNHEMLNGYRAAVFSDQAHKIRGFTAESMELRPPRLQPSLIERFQSEPLPPKSAKPVPVAHNKLLSPIKSPGFISPMSAAHIMEAAAKILEPGFPASRKGRAVSVGLSPVPVKPTGMKGTELAFQSQEKLPETAGRCGESDAVKLLKGHSLNKSWNGLVPTPVFSVSSKENSVDSSNKRKSVSLAIQAKVNVQRREGLSSGDKNSSAWMEHDECRLKQPIKNRQTSLKNKQTKFSKVGVLRQNNQKQNCTSNRDKLVVKSSGSNSKKVAYGDSSFGRRRTADKNSLVSRVNSKKESHKIMEFDNDAQLSIGKNTFRKKRSADGDAYSEQCKNVDADSADGDCKAAESYLTIKDHRNWMSGSGRRSMDVVSFTFTSPMGNPMATSQPSGYSIEKDNKVCCSDHQSRHIKVGAKNGETPSFGLNVIGGDALGVLLEQKLRELTSGNGMSCSNLVKEGNTTASDFSTQDFISVLNSDTTLAGQTDQSGFESDSSCLSTSPRFPESDLQLHPYGEITECSEAPKVLDYRHPSPVSILESSFTNESCNSSESSNSIICCSQTSSTRGQNIIDMAHTSKAALAVSEAELSDSASSSFCRIVDTQHLTGTKTQVTDVPSYEQELDYVRLILLNAADFTLNHNNDIVDPFLFEKLENEKHGFQGKAENTETRRNRRLLFDSVGECLVLKKSLYFNRGYSAWAKGMVMLRAHCSVDAVYKMILDWRNMVDCMVDELVEKDMCTHLGSWMDFEAECFAAGVEIERKIFFSLVDEVAMIFYESF